MTSVIFQIKSHILECQHIREYARATSTTQEEVLSLAIKQYVPLDNLDSQDGDITIIGAHANGFPKELYEPLWCDLHAHSKANGFRIRSIWIADVSNQGESGVLNEKALGNDPSWFDHSRDLLHMINHFRASMPMPIVGIGHSLGAAQLVNLALMHPRLLSTVVLLDPVISLFASAPSGPNPTQASTFRRDIWPSRGEAITSFKKSTFYQSWDPRVFDLWCSHGIRKLPSAVYPEEQDCAVTLSTTKHQECFTFMRPSWEAFSEDGETLINRELTIDLHPKSSTCYPFYRPEPPNLLNRLDQLRPSILYIFGGNSPMSSPKSRAEKMRVTGVGVGGSGGANEGRVDERVLIGIGHLVAMEATEQCADAAAQWLGHEAKRIKAEQMNYLEWTKLSLAEKSMLSEEWKKRIGGPIRPPKTKI